MEFWMLVGLVGLAVWLAVSLPLGLLVGRVIAVMSEPEYEYEPESQTEAAAPSEPAQEFSFFPRAGTDEPISVLVVDDDEHLRELVRTTFELAHVEVREADSAASAARRIAAQHPDVVVLDVAMPGVDGLTFCRALKSDAGTRGIPVILLTGAEDSELTGWQAGANGFLKKPFRPLELLDVVERFALETDEAETTRFSAGADHAEKQVLLYAQDLRHLLEVERGQRRLLQSAYRETVVALAQALEAKDGGTGAHSERVRRYASELARAVQPLLLRESGVEYGFILHDVGKIAIPDAVLRKDSALTDAERRLIENHPVLGEQMVGGAALLRGAGAQVVRSHHERWDGRGYPDGLAGEDIPLPARIFAIADTLDAMTSDRPYRRAGDWPDAVAEIIDKAGTQFDPAIVDTFRDHEEALRRVYYEVNAN